MNWGGILTVIDQIEKLLKKYYVKNVFADSRKIALLAT